MTGITLEDGMNILEAAFDKARSLNLTVAVSVVDARGDLVAAARMDRAIWWWTESSRGKAVSTVAYEGVPSGELLERAARPVAHGLQQMHHGRFMPQQGAMLSSRAAFSSGPSAPPADQAKKTRRSPPPALPRRAVRNLDASKGKEK